MKHRVNLYLEMERAASEARKVGDDEFAEIISDSVLDIWSSIPESDRNELVHSVETTGGSDEQTTNISGNDWVESLSNLDEKEMKFMIEVRDFILRKDPRCQESNLIHNVRILANMYYVEYGHARLKFDGTLPDEIVRKAKSIRSERDKLMSNIPDCMCPTTKYAMLLGSINRRAPWISDLESLEEDINTMSKLVRKM